MKKGQILFAVSEKGTIVPQGKEMQDLLNANKGKRGVLSIKFYDNRDPKKIIGYYKAYIIPQIVKYYKEQEGVYLSEAKAEETIWKLCTVTKDKEIGISKLSVHEIWLYVEEIKYIAANDLGIYID